MRIISTSLFFGLLACILMGFPGLAAAPRVKSAWDIGKLEESREAGPADTFAQDARLFSEAIAFSVMQSQNRVKLPGPFRPYLQAGFHLFQVDAEILKAYTVDGTTSLFSRTLFAKAGIGLPFGLNIEGGMSQVISENSSTAVNLTIAGQTLDFANLVYVDLVPCVSTSATMTRTIGGPGLWNFAGQAVLGAYHRLTLAQVGYILQYNYTVLRSLTPSISNTFFRHGVMMSMPIFKGLFAQTEVFYPSMSATMSAGVQF
jgi:hypothetical protein